MATPTVDTAQLARLFDVNPRTIRRLTNDAVLVRARDDEGQELRGRYELLINVRSYCKHLRDQNRLDDTSETKYAMLRNQKMAADAQMSDLKLAEYKGELHRSPDVEFIMTNMLTAFKQRALAIPSRTARTLVGITNYQTIYERLYGEIELMLRELSSYDRSMFTARRQEYLEAQGIDPSILDGEQGDNGETDDDELTDEGGE
jgi:phage terminase Nu1 subunit (DNA packaging protein)